MKPFIHATVVWSEGQKPAVVQLDGAGQDQEILVPSFQFHEIDCVPIPGLRVRLDPETLALDAVQCLCWRSRERTQGPVLEWGTVEAFTPDAADIKPDHPRLSRFFAPTSRFHDAGLTPEVGLRVKFDVLGKLYPE